jgi:serine/threonine protein kinase
VSWFHIKDADPMEFGNRGENRNLTNSPDWLWEFKGQLMILSSPHIPGSHYATSVSQLQAAVEQLESLHNKGYVHGDIRAFNIIFGPGTADLIDFDIGGVENRDSTVYPEGYNQALRDSHRLGKAGKPITKRHDWRALCMVLFSLHIVLPPPRENANSDPQDAPESPGFAFQQMKDTLNEQSNLLRRETLLQRFAATQDPSPDEIRELKVLLEAIGSWNVGPSIEFQDRLSTVGLLGSSSAKDTSQLATGSTSKEPATIAL